MKNIAKRALSLLQHSVQKMISAVMLFVVPTVVFADLPTMQAASRGNGSGIMDTIKNYAYDGVVLAALLVAAYAFIKVAGALIDGYSEVSAGRKKWGELGTLALVGAVMLVVLIWLLAQAVKIL